MSIVWFEPEPGAVAAAVQIGGVAIRGDKHAIALEIEYADAYVGGDTFWAILNIYHHLARELRSPAALIELHAELLEIANDSQRLCRRRAAALLAAHSHAADAEHLGDNELRWHAIGELNAAIAEVYECDLFVPIFAAALEIRQELLPEITAPRIEFAARTLWS